MAEPAGFARIPFDVDRYVAGVNSGRECFICRIVSGADPRHEIVYRDGAHIAFFNRFPTLPDYTLVAPLEHREQVVADFDLDEYLALQTLVHRIGRAMAEVLPTERLYLMSLGSQQANSHVHWHVAALPPGVPYRDQQFAALMADDKGYLEIPPAERPVGRGAPPGAGGPGRMNPYEMVRPLLVERVIPAYRQLGSIAFVYAQGSLVEGLATEADLDLVVVWDGEPPPVPARARLGLAEPTPKPEWFQEQGFILDRFWMAGQQIDTKHVSIAEVRDWVERVEAGGGTSGYPMPAVALAGFLVGDVLADEGSQARALRDRLQSVPAALVTHTSAVFAAESLDLVLEQLEACTARGDGLLFYSMATDLMRRAYMAWFARQGRYWPHEKRLQTRLVQLGRADLAEGDAAMWSGELPEALLALRRQLNRLRVDDAPAQSET